MIAPMSQERRGCSAISFNGRIYVAGGHYKGGDYVTLRTVEAYDPNTDQWERLADLTIQRYPLEFEIHVIVSGQKPTLIVSDGKLMVLGGYSDFWDQERLSSVEEYDKENNTWKERREM
ncbi:hypothetical protein PRIPAC_92098, partial [Pristionchus pacificus]|uniref:Uncharacterized protein n=1 Tax=Pristionchus pacificus TaxID=54126 RepID=A0A2A6BQJ9_PRIPA